MLTYGPACHDPAHTFASRAVLFLSYVGQNWSSVVEWSDVTPLPLDHSSRPRATPSLSYSIRRDKVGQSNCRTIIATSESPFEVRLRSGVCHCLCSSDIVSCSAKIVIGCGVNHGI
jgi:hypothetical protein